jgi:hypothetical protein
MMLRGRVGRWMDRRKRRGVSTPSSGLLLLRSRCGKNMIVSGGVDIECYGVGVWKIGGERATLKAKSDMLPISNAGQDYSRPKVGAG